MAEFEPKPKFKPAGQHEIDLVNRGLDGDQDALLEILERGEMIVVEQPNPGKTIADPGAEARTFPMEE